MKSIDKAQELADQSDIPLWLALEIIEEQDSQPVLTDGELFEKFIKHFQGDEDEPNAD